MTPFIITAVLVGFVTYALVFNLENLAKLLGRVYFKQRRRLLRAMEEDPDPAWQDRRERFEGFPPDDEVRKSPSEWRTIWYLTHALRRKRRDKVESESTA